jgi:hypothetical protein
MAKVLGFNPPNESYVELNDTIKLQRSLIEELIKLNEGYEEEVKRLVGEYDKIYVLYTTIEEILKHYDPMQYGFPKVVDKEFMERIISRRNNPNIEFMDFSKPIVDEQV